MDVEHNLARLGIAGNLFKVYSAAIEMGEGPVAEIIARTGLPRATVYDAIARLEQEGLIDIAEQAGKRRVLARDPSVLLEHLEARRQMVSDMMPQLRSMYNHARGKPHIRFYEGAEGVRTALWDSLNCRSGLLLATFSMYELKQTPGFEQLDAYRRERIERGIRMQVIRSRSRDTEDIWRHSEQDLRELRFAPETLTLQMTTLIYDHCVALVSSRRENYGLIIESEEFAALQRAMFEAMWSISEPAVPIGASAPAVPLSTQETRRAP